MPHSFLEQATGTDSLDASSSDDPFPIGVFKFLKIVFLYFFLQTGRRETLILPLKSIRARNFSVYFVFQRYEEL